MADLDSYLAYKRETKYLVFWLLHTSNSIITTKAPREPNLEPNTTGQVTVATLVPLAELISRYTKSTPTIVLRVFRTVISARKATCVHYARLAAQNPDDLSLARGNASHRHFNDALEAAYIALGGEDQLTAALSEEHSDYDVEELERMVFSNSFSALSVEGSDEDSGAEPVSVTNIAPIRKQQRKPGKGRRGRRGSRIKGGRHDPSQRKALEGISVDGFGIISDDDSHISIEYVMAVSCLAEEWCHLRSWLNMVWFRAAHGKLNNAVAGVITKVAFSIQKQTELAIFVDFQGRDSYKSVLEALNSGRNSLSLDKSHFLNTSDRQDLKEQCLAHTYRYLIDFIADYQKTRTGKPTKPMLREIGSWSPNACLSDFTRPQRLKWRRAYTINWLYDLVNTYAYPAIKTQGSAADCKLEDIDWSANGPWNPTTSNQRRLYGLNEFAAAVTTLAMQKEGKDVSTRIPSSLVFQLQIIVDSFTVSYGWMNLDLKDAQAQYSLQPPRTGMSNIFNFIFGEARPPGCGCGNKSVSGTQDGAHDLHNIVAQEYPSRFAQTKAAKLLYRTIVDMDNFLGKFWPEDNQNATMAGIHASRFSNVVEPGLCALWEYSPALCGTGLAEAIDYLHNASILMLNKAIEVVCLMHIYNKVRQTGHLAQPIDIFEILQVTFPGVYRDVGGVPPTKGPFGASMWQQMVQTEKRGCKRPQPFLPNTFDVDKVLVPQPGGYFDNSTLLYALRSVEWDPCRVADHDLALYSSLRRYRRVDRWSRTKAAENLGEKESRAARERVAAVTEEEIRAISSLKSTFAARSWLDLPPYKTGPEDNENRDEQDSLMRSFEQGCLAHKWRPELDNSKAPGRDRRTRHETMLARIECDIYNEICGGAPILGLNLPRITVVLMKLFGTIEDALSAARNKTWAAARLKYVSSDCDVCGKKQRMALAKCILNATDDEECLKIVAKVFERPELEDLADASFWNFDLDMTEFYGMHLCGCMRKSFLSGFVYFAP
ncbi:hypothetical protein PpBr36_00643 [Pyricularia pennisetigena]|uniref:hypothetical protein n=1 Tax=Pyricularia pennisetigena TaxID=1578925 RepID=UPI001151229C|nr:hypothetical protein PpBr36_00643 [Pyricularia pennisetigena]TLS29521.1 hypothetical protein PpBr36_00643 [Pyricularia pennisetigena]